MATYYVRKDGNDTTGDGSSATPWLTVAKAIATLTLTENHTIRIGPGVYEENYSGLGYLYLNRFPNSGFLWTFEAEDPADKPVIQPGGTPIYLLRFATSTSRLTFSNLIFDWNEVATLSSLVSITAGTTVADITFDGCEFRWGDSTVYGISAIMTGATKSLARVTVEDCLFTFEGADADYSAYGMRFSLSTGISISDVTIRNCVCSMPGKPLWLDGVSNFLVEGCSFASVGSYGLIIGADGAATTGANSGTVSNCFVASGSGHALLVGWLSDGVTVQACQVHGGNQGVVVKEAANVLVTGNTIIGGTDSSLYFKGANNCQATYNRISNDGGILARVGWNDVSTHQVENITITRNKLKGSGSAPLLYWGQASEDLGGGVCDFNKYKPGGSAKFGAVKGDAAVATLAELRAAWDGYGAGENDSHSRLWQEFPVFLVTR